MNLQIQQNMNNQTTFQCGRYLSGVHVLLVSLFGIPIVWSISHFFGRPKKIWLTKKKILVYQKKIWYTKKKFGQPKQEFGRPKKNLVYQKKVWYTEKKIGQPKK